MNEEINERAVIGDNNPPEKTPFELSEEAIHDLYEEAKLWLDGEPVTTQEQADALNTLLSKIKEAAKEADERRKEEAKPHDDAKAEIQERYNALIGETTKVTGLTVKAEQAVKAALDPYLRELARQQEEAAKEAREEAERKQHEAMEAMQSRDKANLAGWEEAEMLAHQAKEAEYAARKAENAKAHAKGSGRATGFRAVKRAVMIDQREAAAWVWKERREELMAFVQDQADKAVRAGTHSIQGFEIKEEKVL